MAGPDQPEIDRLTRTLLNAYAQADKLIADELEAIANEARHYRRRARLRELRDEIAELKVSLDQQAQDWSDNELREIYDLGAQRGAQQVGVGFSFSQAHEQALKQAARDTTRSMLSATTHMSKDAKRLIRASAKEATLMKLLTGQTAVQAGRGLEKTLKAAEIKGNPISAIVYKDGSRRSLKEYSQVVLRSNTAVAYNSGTLIEGREQGSRYAIAFDGPGCCLGPGHRNGPEANNLILPIGEAMRALISHAQCRRAWSILPGIRSKKQAEAAMEEGTYATTAGQDAAQRAADEVTRGQQKLAARRRARDRRIAARSAAQQAS